jgi:tRNA pseudouridine55 synthase
MEGILLVDKPMGWTSFDVVAKVRGVLRASGLNKPKVGHSGTLDPLATGLLVLLVGSYTKKAESLTRLDKTYEVTMKLGETSTTADGEGEITQITTQKPNISKIEKVIEQFIGQIDQIPPAYSAIKVDGQRAYKLVRKGITPDLKARKVHIYSIEIRKYDYPKVELKATVSSGTYIRSLVQDIGQSLETGAYMSALRRDRVGKYMINDAIGPEDLTAELIHNHLLTG